MTVLNETSRYEHMIAQAKQRRVGDTMKKNATEGMCESTGSNALFQEHTRSFDQEKPLSIPNDSRRSVYSA